MKTKDVTTLAREKKVAALKAVGLQDPKHPDSIFFRASGKIAKTKGYAELEVHPIFPGIPPAEEAQYAVTVKFNFINAEQVAALRCFLSNQILVQPK